MNRCKGTCKEGGLVGYEIRLTHRNSYALGWLRCRRCEFYIKNVPKSDKGYFLCPCCQCILSNKPRNAKHKRILNDKIGVKRY